MSRKILIFAPHADDETLGCGGIIAKNTFLGNLDYFTFKILVYGIIKKKE